MITADRQKGSKMDQEVPKRDNSPRSKRLRIQNAVLIILIAAMTVTGLYLILEPVYVHWMQDRIGDELLDNFESGDGTVVIDPNAYAVSGEDDDYLVEETEPTLTSEQPTTTVTESVSTSATTSETTAKPTPTAAPEQITITAIGRIKIPKINVNLPIAEGATKYTLRYAIGHYTYSVGLGEPGLSILLGHRSYTYGRMFNRMGEVSTGDKIIIETKKFRYTYEIDRIDIVLPENLTPEFYAQYDTSRIMLITCDPIRIASHRMLVKAGLIKTEPLG